MTEEELDGIEERRSKSDAQGGWYKHANADILKLQAEVRRLQGWEKRCWGLLSECREAVKLPLHLAVRIDEALELVRIEAWAGCPRGLWQAQKSQSENRIEGPTHTGRPSRMTAA